MKNLICVALFFMTLFCAQAQDTIVKVNGDKILSKITEISSPVIKYKKASNINGPIYTLHTSKIKQIIFENGDVENFVGKALTMDPTEVNNDVANVYFIRSTGFAGSMSAFTAFIDKELVCKLNNKKYSIHEVSPGEHYFTVQFAGKKSKKKAEPIKINLEGGKTYYIQMVFQTGAFKNNLYCQEVTENSANTILIECEEDTKCL